MEMLACNVNWKEWMDGGNSKNEYVMVHVEVIIIRGA
jgi:hypothetical protein